MSYIGSSYRVRYLRTNRRKLERKNMRRENNIPNYWKSGEKSHERDPPSSYSVLCGISDHLILYLFFSGCFHF